MNDYLSFVHRKSSLTRKSLTRGEGFRVSLIREEHMIIRTKVTVSFVVIDVEITFDPCSIPSIYVLLYVGIVFPQQSVSPYALEEVQSTISRDGCVGSTVQPQQQQQATMVWCRSERGLHDAYSVRRTFPTSQPPEFVPATPPSKHACLP